jgi:hypothetical protein
MAHWAEIDENNIVIRVVVGDNNDPNGDEGYSWLVNHLGGRWIKTSYNTNCGVHKTGGIALRKNYAGVGYIYDEERDAFYSTKPTVGSWEFNEEMCCWVEVTE